MSLVSSLSRRHLRHVPSSYSGRRVGELFRFSSVALTDVDDATGDATSEPDRSSHPKYPRLFSPLDLGPDIGVLPNRALMGSMHSGLEGHSMPRWMVPLLMGSSSSSHDDRDSLSAMGVYFQERAAGGVGLMVTGGIAPNYQGWTGPFSSQLTNEREVHRHKVVTDAVHQVQVPIYGTQENVPARICLQILHTGRYAYHPLAVSASKTKSPISPFTAAALTKSGLAKTTKDFVNTAVLAKEAGYDGVEIMGSEGYLLSQFLAPRTNKRTDDYGGSLVNRARLPLEIVQQTRQAVGADFIIIFRLSLLDLVEGGLSFTESVQMAHWLQESGVTILNTGIGWVSQSCYPFEVTRKYREYNIFNESHISYNVSPSTGTARSTCANYFDCSTSRRLCLSYGSLTRSSR